MESCVYLMFELLFLLNKLHTTELMLNVSSALYILCRMGQWTYFLFCAPVPFPLVTVRLILRNQIQLGLALFTVDQ